MKANELMIGDWVRWVYVCSNGVVAHNGYKKVGAINSDESIDLIYEDALYEHVPMDEVQAVKLTEKILEKNGFSVCGGKETYAEESDYYGKLTYLHVQYNKYGDLHIWRDYVYAQGREQHVIEYEPKLHLRTLYVHELQHALRLCGIEKEIVL